MFYVLKKPLNFLLICLFVITTLNHVIATRRKYDQDQLFTLPDGESLDDGNYDLVIKFKNGFDDDLITDLFATAHNLERVARILELKDKSMFHFKLRESDKKHRRRRKRYLSNKIDQLKQDDRIEFVLLQPYLKREKRAHLFNENDELLNNEIKRLFDELGVNDNFKLNSKIIGDAPQFNDEEYSKEWYLVNIGQLNTPKDHDLNVKEAWLKGFTGKNITIVIIDDGLDWQHPDFVGKYVSFCFKFLSC
jgi:subtilisin family serine protease